MVDDLRDARMRVDAALPRLEHFPREAIEFVHRLPEAIDVIFFQARKDFVEGQTRQRIGGGVRSFLKELRERGLLLKTMCPRQSSRRGQENRPGFRNVEAVK